MAKNTIVPVALGDRSYDIIIGRGALSALADRWPTLNTGKRAAIVTDAHVNAHYGASVEATLGGLGVAATIIEIPPGEASKSYALLQTVCDGVLAARIERNDMVIALGGGVVGDLAGFAAAVVRRGLRFVQIPTTLLAQVDSSVGGKTGINSAHGKNQVGAFHQPSLVIADTALLDTLPAREFRAGYAEVLKYALIDDRSFFDWLETRADRIFAGGPERDHAVAVSCRSKAAIVARDERETGDRALLNLGHTFAHALERATNYDGRRLVHGEAVAIGLSLAFRFSVELGLASGQDSMRVDRHLRGIGLPTRIGDINGAVGDPDSLLDAMRQDKKVSDGRLTFILMRGIGESFIARDVAAANVRRFLAAEMAHA
ncbi:MAG: 3-dehydroquinate synthase [Beijerinckiaceae bacterium]